MDRVSWQCFLQMFRSRLWLRYCILFLLIYGILTLLAWQPYTWRNFRRMELRDTNRSEPENILSTKRAGDLPDIITESQRLDNDEHTTLPPPTPPPASRPWVVYAPSRNQSARTEGMFPYLKNYKNPCWEDTRRTRTMLRCLPYVYVLGMAKSGTTTLCTCLDFHPEVVAPDMKELSFWRTDSNTPNVDQYTPKLYSTTKKLQAAKISKGNEYHHHKITYDGTPSYVWHLPHLPKLIHQINPAQKMIVTMRHPTDRLFSHYHHVCTRLNKVFKPEDFHTHITHEVSLIQQCYEHRQLHDCVIDIATDEISVGLSVYYVYVKSWLDIFPSNQILFIKAEEFYSNITLVMDGVFRFLELSDPSEGTIDFIRGQMQDYIPPAFESWANKAGIVKSRALGQDKDILHEARGTWISYRDTMLKETRDILDEFYKPFNKMLADILNDDRFLFERS